MTRRTPRNRRAVLRGACAATLTMMAASAAGAAKAAELDGELIALLDEARRLCREEDAQPLTAKTFADFACRQPWQDLVERAARMPARTPEGLRAKAEAVRWWVLSDHRTACDRFNVPQEWLAVSLVEDLLGRGGA
ncbi:hypothetical protein J8J14_09555 [Roseomonas sp. SSH11]|uniref:Secreted protein n=1 Tax=Pararoseomonas baculiformis TaxID=2820812 RepID=A0ABS4ADD2_9PROT|nr:hypothetical protein [Pararoseomonas baculiformis]MBP0445025.1 hypothetical protein [Pararoseomonas baculiformis]